MKLIKIFIILYFGSILLWPTVFAADKYIVPILPLLLLVLARNMERWRWLLLAVVAALLLNVAYVGRTAVRQVRDNIAYIRGDRYAGYSPEARKWFKDIEKTRELPLNTTIVAAKPMFVYLLTGRSCVHPRDVKENE